VFITGTDHANDLEVGQGSDFIAIQPQRAASQDGVDLAAVPGDRLDALGGRRGEDQVEALMFEDRQVIIDGFNQYQNGYGHAGLLWASDCQIRTSLEIADSRAVWQSLKVTGCGKAMLYDK